VFLKKVKIFIKCFNSISPIVTALTTIFYLGITYCLLSATRESYTAVQRPFVNYDDPTFTKYIPIDPDEIRSSSYVQYQIDMKVKNTGNTPTVDLKYNYGKIMKYSSFPFNPRQPGTPPDWTEPADPVTHLENQNLHRAILGPKQKKSIFPDVTNGLHVLGSMQSGISYFVYGYFSYKDNFSSKNNHITKFCFKENISSVSRSDPMNPVLTTTPCSHWNCADVQCDDDKMQFVREVLEAYRNNHMQPSSDLIK